MLGVSNITNRMDPNSLRSRLFVGNLNTLHIQKSELEVIFQKYGKIIGLSVHKGYAFIQYADEISARAALTAEDGKSYFNMSLDVSLASEPKNRKRGRSNTGLILSDQPNLVELALQSHVALAAIGGQFSQLDFFNQQSSHQNRSSGFNLRGIIGTPLLSNGPKTSKASPSSHVSSAPRQWNRPSYAQPANSASTAKRTRLENPSSGNKLAYVVSPNRECVSPKSTPSVDSSSPCSKSSKRLLSSSARTSDSIISDKLSGMTVDNRYDLRSIISSEGEKSSTPRDISTNDVAQPSPSTATPSGHSEQNSQSQLSNSFVEDILICGRCRRLFESIDALLSHKTTNCCATESKNGDSGHSCRCKIMGEPESLCCFFCNEEFLSSWELLEHCRSEHNLTVFKTRQASKHKSPSPTKQRHSSVSSLSNTSEKGRSSRKDEGKSSNSQSSEEPEPVECDESIVGDKIVLEIGDSPAPLVKEITILSDEDYDDADIDIDRGAK